jgi:hypothetical protein
MVRYISYKTAFLEGEVRFLGSGGGEGGGGIRVRILESIVEVGNKATQ